MIVGGLGGIGRSISRWMVKQGVKNIVLVSRSAKTQPNVQDLTNELEKAGCRVVVHSCDIADSAQLAQMLQVVGKEMPPIRGIIQGAMVLKVCYHSLFKVTATLSNISIGLCLRIHALRRLPSSTSSQGPGNLEPTQAALENRFGFLRYAFVCRWRCRQS